MKKDQRKKIDVSFNVAYVIITLIIFSYFSIWFIVRNRMKDILSNKTIKYSIEYSRLSVKVFPFSVKTTIKGLGLDIKVNENMNIKLYIEKITAKNIIFNKRISLDISNNISYKINDRESKFTLNESNINFILGKNNKIKNINFTADSINIIDSSDKEDFKVETNIRGFLFKTIDINTKNYSNRTIKMNVDSSIGKYDNKYLEINFDMIVSEITDIDPNGRIVSTETNVESINFNDITNNYGLNITGNYEINPSKGRGIAKLELKIINYNSLLTALNNDESIFLFKKNILQTAVESLKLVPKNSKDSIYDKYYTFESNVATKTMTINGGDIKELLQGLIFKK